jgi:hypothetical protein
MKFMANKELSLTAFSLAFSGMGVKIFMCLKLKHFIKF